MHNKNTVYKIPTKAEVTSMNPQDNIIVNKGLLSVHTKASFHMSIKTNLIRHLQHKAPPKVHRDILFRCSI